MATLKTSEYAGPWSYSAGYGQADYSASNSASQTTISISGQAGASPLARGVCYGFRHLVYVSGSIPARAGRILNYS
jgi:hypothetical protein